MFHGISILFLLLIYLFPHIRVSSATANVEPHSGLSAVLQPPSSPDVWIPRSHGRNTRSIFQRVGASILEQRTDPPGSNPMILKMKLVTYQAVASIAPIAEAARYLEGFYNSIAASAAGIWQTQPRREMLTIEQGPLEFMISSMGDTIPWEFVQEMANRLQLAASMGMATLFEAIYMDEGAKIGVAVSLRLINPDGSRSSSVTQYDREGSVPSVGSPYD